jgi:L-rhamnose mutarotase
VEYLAAHKRVWPEVKEALRVTGIMEEKIWLLGNRMFMLVVTDDDFDWDRDTSEYLELPRTREWDELMRKLQTPVPEAGKDDWWAPMEKVFDLNWPDDSADE